MWRGHRGSEGVAASAIWRDRPSFENNAPFSTPTDSKGPLPCPRRLRGPAALPPGSPAAVPRSPDQRCARARGPALPSEGGSVRGRGKIFWKLRALSIAGGFTRIVAIIRSFPLPLVRWRSDPSSFSRFHRTPRPIPKHHSSAVSVDLWPFCGPIILPPSPWTCVISLPQGVDLVALPPRSGWHCTT